MPIYEYRCLDCGRKVSIFWRSLSAVNDEAARCDRCNSRRLVRLVSRVRVLRSSSGESDINSDTDDALLDEMANLNENDPRALGRFMRRMAEQSGEDLGPEFEEVVGRLEKGEDPEQIEKRMGDIFGDEMGGPDEDASLTIESPSAKKDAEEEDKEAAAKRRTVVMKPKRKAATKRSRPKATSKKVKRQAAQ